MPWICVATSPLDEDHASADLAVAVAESAAEATGLDPGDVIVLVDVATAASQPGGVVVVRGRDRGPEVETRLAARLSSVVADRLGIAEDLVLVERR